MQVFEKKSEPISLAEAKAKSISGNRLKTAKNPQALKPCGFCLVEHSGIEPLTSTLPVWRSPS